MTIPFSSMRLGEATFTHVHSDGRNTVIASGRLYDWVQANASRLSPVFLPIDPAIARSWVDDNIVSLQRVHTLAARRALTPPILCRDAANDALYVDGHHRYVLAYMLHMPGIPVYLLEPHDWTPFLIEGAPATTREALLASPITQRPY